jgi:hypothetical protein
MQFKSKGLDSLIDSYNTTTDVTSMTIDCQNSTKDAQLVYITGALTTSGSTLHIPRIRFISNWHLSLNSGTGGSPSTGSSPYVQHQYNAYSDQSLDNSSNSFGTNTYINYADRFVKTNTHGITFTGFIHKNQPTNTSGTVYNSTHIQLRVLSYTGSTMQQTMFNAGSTGGGSISYLITSLEFTNQYGGFKGEVKAYEVTRETDRVW